MKALYNSMNNKVFKRITRKGWIWIVILFICAIFYYLEFFIFPVAILLAVFITLVIVSILMVGYLKLGSKQSFSVGQFIFFTILFSALRFAYIYFFLSHHLPEYTLFHYPNRSLPATIFGSASLLFLGYAYAIYEWGLAARQNFLESQSEHNNSILPPIIIRSNGANIYILADDLVFVSANGEYVNYHTTTKKHTTYKRLKNVESELEKFGFMRSHRSYIVNVRHIQSISANKILLRDGNTVPLSKTYKELIRNEMNIK